MGSVLDEIRSIKQLNLKMCDCLSKTEEKRENDG